MENPTIPVVSAYELTAFHNSRQIIIENAIKKILINQEFQKICGEKSEEILRSGMTFTAETLESIMTVSFPDIITQQLTWGNEYLSGIGIPAEMVLQNFQLFAESMQEILPEKLYPAPAAWMQMIIKIQQDFVKSV